ncbi:hypothetical protein HYR99_38625 [Candidatus Poribacteria bacterium]|nr:hypothetical protein [Candidatus Poribacteria bacterium]
MLLEENKTLVRRFTQEVRKQPTSIAITLGVFLTALLTLISCGEEETEDFGFEFLSTVEAYAPETDTWMKKADMPTPRWDLSTSVVNGKIYAIGGAGHDGFLGTVEEYDPATNAWTIKADMPTPRDRLSTSVVNGKIYAIGGAGVGGELTTVEEYDPATDNWTKKADMLTPRYQLSTSVVNGKIYAIGGRQFEKDLFEWGVAIVEEYDPATNQWTRKAGMPTARRDLSTNMVDGKIYAIGGWDDKSLVEVYDPVTNTWARKADAPHPRGYSSASVVNGKIYVIGGGLDDIVDFLSRVAVSAVEAYDPETDTWTTKADMPTPRWSFSTSVVDGKIYAIGGKFAAPVAFPHQKK